MGATVTVGCKLPHGLIAEFGGQTVKFNGLNTTVIIGGHGITQGVDEEFWNAWSSHNSDMAFLKNGFIFADKSSKNVEAQAKDRQNEKTGFEGLDPKAKTSELEGYKAD